MKYDFDTVIDRHHTSSMKWCPGKMLKEMGITERFDDGTIAVYTADMDFRCAQPVIDAMKKVAEHGIFGYSGIKGMPEYNRAVCRWFRERHDWSFDEEAVLFVNGTVKALELAIRAYTKKGDGIIITRPVYGPFASAIEKNQRRVVNSDLINQDGYYTMDFEDIERKAEEKDVSMFILCNPHNPTGRVWTYEELKRLAEICERNYMLLLSDEVHCDLVRKGVRFVPAAKVGSAENTVVLTAINKTFNCAGLACSHAVISDAGLREGFETVNDSMPNPFGIAAVIAAYTDGDEWLEQLNEYLDGTVNWAVDYIHEKLSGVKVWKPEGTYVLWMDFKNTGLSPEEVHDRIYNKANVCLEPGEMFDPVHGRSFERICIPSPRSVIREAFYRIGEQFRDVRGEM